MARRAESVAALEARLGYVFADRELIETALTHASARAARRCDNERLEFLGDRVLGLVIATAVLDADSDAGVGDLTKRLHGLVSGEACAQVARDLGLGEALRLPPGETRRGARDQDAILGDACEALIAALYLELGLDGAAALVLRLWSPLLAEPLDPAAANPKSELQEWAAARGLAGPAYRLIGRSGPDHAPSFTIEVSVAGEAPETARAGSRRAAEKASALALLRRVRPNP